MPAFETPEPVHVTFAFDAGTLRVTAGDRTDTVVDVRPGDSTEEADVRAARQLDVSCVNGALRLKGPRARSLFGRSGVVDIRLELPAGSHLRGTAPLADFVCAGRLGDCRLRTSLGDIRVEEAADAELTTAHGDIAVDRVRGDAGISGSGRIDVGTIGGTGTVRNGNGPTVIGEIAGDLRANTANGGIYVGVAHGAVDARTASGDIRVGEVRRGRTTVQTATGDLEIGVGGTTAAWLDAHTRFGSLHNDLAPAADPDASEETVEVRARTGIGDILVRRP